VSQKLLLPVLGIALLGASPPATAQATDLMDVYELSVRNDATFQAAAATHRAAQHSPDIARAGLLPTIDATASTSGNLIKSKVGGSVFNPSSGSRKFNDHDYTFTVTQPLYRKDRWIALDQARVEVDQADATFAFERQSLMLRAAERYFDVLRAEDELTFARAELEAFGQQLEQSQQRFEVGLIAITDVEEARSGFDLARAQVIQAEVALDNAREALREVTGEYHLAVAALGGELPLELPLPNDIDRWTETALTQNLQLAGVRHAADRSRLEIQRVEAGHLPTLDLVGSHGRDVVKDSRSGGGSGIRDNINTVVGLQLNVPIFAGGSVVSRTRQSRQLYDRDLDEVERVRRLVQRTTRDAFLQIRSGISRVNALEQAVRSAQAAAEAIEAGFQVGTRTSVDVLNAQRDVFRAKRDLSNARYDYIIDTLTLKQAAGTLEVHDLELVDSWLE